MMKRSSSLARRTPIRRASQALARHGALARKSPLARGARPTRRPRTASEFQRIYGGDEREAWTKQHPCILPGCGRTPCDAAHLIPKGTGMKADAAWAVAFCATDVRTGYVGHHDEYDNGKRSFMTKYFPHTTRAELAAAFEAAWQRECARRAAIGEQK